MPDVADKKRKSNYYAQSFYKKKSANKKASTPRDCKSTKVILTTDSSLFLLVGYPSNIAKY